MIVVDTSWSHSSRVEVALNSKAAEENQPEIPFHLLLSALSATDVSLIIQDATKPELPIVWVNEAYTRTTGYSRQHAVGKTIDHLRGEESAPETIKALDDAVARGESASATLLNVRADGTRFWNQVRISPISDDADTITHWVRVNVDVTDEVRARQVAQSRLASEREAWSGLNMLSQISDALVDMDISVALTAVSHILVPEAASWVKFLTYQDGVLEPARTFNDEVDAQQGPQKHRLRIGQLPEVICRMLVEDEREILHLPVVEVAREVPATRGDGSTRMSLAYWAQLQVLPALAQSEVEPEDVYVLPIPDRTAAGGLLVFAPRRDNCDDLTRQDVKFLTEVARRVGQSIENTRMYDQEHALAETLQRAMLPELVDVPGLDIWTYYAPSARHAQVGGDWFDVLQPEDDSVGLVIGDVAGHDVEAAATMGQLRSIVRSYAFELHSPHQVLDRVDQLIAGMPISRAASLIYGVLSEKDAGWGFTWSRAGHLPPLVIRDGTVIVLSEGAGILVGFGHGERKHAQTVLQPGDVLVLYTDGLIERRTRSMRDGLDYLVQVCQEIDAPDAAGIGEELMNRLADAPEDDIAIVVVRVPGGQESDQGGLAANPRQRRWLLPGEPSSISRARQSVVLTCETWGVSGVKNVELVVSELVANAVLHGWGPVSLRLFDTGDGVRLEVEDSNPTPPVEVENQSAGIGGFGMRIVERLADWGWRPSGSGKVVWARMREPGGPEAA